jgi:hypothetical protein
MTEWMGLGFSEIILFYVTLFISIYHYYAFSSPFLNQLLIPNCMRAILQSQEPM